MQWSSPTYGNLRANAQSLLGCKRRWHILLPNVGFNERAAGQLVQINSIPHCTHFHPLNDGMSVSALPRLSENVFPLTSLGVMQCTYQKKHYAGIFFAVYGAVMGFQIQNGVRDTSWGEKCIKGKLEVDRGAGKREEEEENEVDGRNDRMMEKEWASTMHL